MSNLRQHLNLLEVRIPIIVRALDRGHTEQAAYHLKTARAHALVLGLASGTGRMAVLKNAFEDAMEPLGALSSNNNELTFEGTLNIDTLARHVLW